MRVRRGLEQGFTPEVYARDADVTIYRAKHDTATLSLALVMVWGRASAVILGVDIV